jgi:molybdopterin converting factor small subunit
MSAREAASREQAGFWEESYKTSQARVRELEEKLEEITSWVDGPRSATILARAQKLEARVRELEDALRAERERCAQIAESQTLAEQTTWTQAGAHVARVIREGET